ncbi:CBS domain-containing protein [Tateyamaria sp. SN3-11]|uniref:CBS domain-containing protein n=1 Tax=Tateyamaria sp. SN3-11 TaxID=3092147 RepID=UPI0039E9BB25
MKISEILDQKGRDVITVQAGASLKEISDVLTEHNVGAAVVLTRNDAVCGIVSERDVIRHMSQGGLVSLDDPVSCRMTSDVVFSDGSESVDTALRIMTDGRFRHLPVLEDGALAGLVSIGDVVKHKIAATEQNANELIRYIANDGYAA